MGKRFGSISGLKIYPLRLCKQIIASQPACS